MWASDHFALPLPEGHPFPAAKYTLLRERLLEESVIAPHEVSRSLPAPLEWLEETHDPARRDRVRRRSLEGYRVDE